MVIGWLGSAERTITPPAVGLRENTLTELPVGHEEVAVDVERQGHGLDHIVRVAVGVVLARREYAHGVAAIVGHEQVTVGCVEGQSGGPVEAGEGASGVGVLLPGGYTLTTFA